MLDKICLEDYEGVRRLYVFEQVRVSTLNKDSHPESRPSGQCGTCASSPTNKLPDHEKTAFLPPDLDQLRSTLPNRALVFRFNSMDTITYDVTRLYMAHHIVVS